MSHFSMWRVELIELVVEQIHSMTGQVVWQYETSSYFAKWNFMFLFCKRVVCFWFCTNSVCNWWTKKHHWFPLQGYYTLTSTSSVQEGCTVEGFHMYGTSSGRFQASRASPLRSCSMNGFLYLHGACGWFQLFFRHVMPVHHRCEVWIPLWKFVNNWRSVSNFAWALLAATGLNTAEMADVNFGQGHLGFICCGVKFNLFWTSQYHDYIYIQYIYILYMKKGRIDGRPQL